ncbi:MAG: hypothetical protein KY445_07305 [Armatimonadetes bacterium]|nr:hypothetical protein [Armatimonadota bacterium]
MSFFRRLLAPKAQNDTVLELLNHTFIAVAFNENRDFSDNDGTPEKMAEWIERNAQEAASRDQDRLFEYEEANLVLVPVWTNAEYITEWLPMCPVPYDGFTALTTFEFGPGKLFRLFADVPDFVRLLINPLRRDERLLTAGEMKLLAHAITQNGVA